MASSLIINNHPILVDQETRIVMDLRPGESLYSFLHRHIPDLDAHAVTVHVKGKPVPMHLWTHYKPKDGYDIVVRSTVHKTALYIVAMAALVWFTMGAGAAIAAETSFAGVVTSGSIMGMSAAASMATIGAMQVVGALVINKVLGPKPPKPQSIDRDAVYSLSAARNQARQYEPVGLLFGSVRVTPDVISMPYSTYRGNDQYLSMVLSPGINVDRYDELYLGENLLSNYEGVRVWKSGFSGMADDVIPVAGNVDSTAGGVLEAGEEVIRTTSLGTVRIQVDISYLLFDLTSKGKKKDNQEDIRIRYRKVGSPVWEHQTTYHIVSREQSEQRRSYTFDVTEGQYEVGVTRMGNDTDGSGATCEFNFTTMVSYQRDTATYKGISRIAIEMKASGQLNGAPDEIRAVMHARPIPLWTGTEWVTATTRANGLSNVAANCLQYLRGYFDEDGNLIAGMGWPDEMIDIDSFKNWMVVCTTYGYNYDAWITGDRSHEDLLSAMALAGMGKVTFAPGRATAVWAAPDQGTDAIVNMATIKKASFQVDYTLVSAADGIEFTYFDRTDWQTKTLRVPSPGVETSLNPATVSGEGITDEAHAAIMARYHMAQMIYQRKDIVYGTDLEHLAYGELSMIQLQHDLTQWGFGGRINHATNVGGVVTLHLDDIVPPPPADNAYIGLRIPGEQSYRVLKVKEFSERTNVIELDQPWPSDAPFPGVGPNNPAHDTIWIYDFKQTPGLRCRVVAVSPEDDLKGAQVAVVPEVDEFWHYVMTGEYIPPSNQSLLQTNPIASNLRAREERVSQGDTVFSRISATWDVAGFATECVVSCGLVDQPAVEVARTDGRSATWRVDEPGDYIVMVRPMRNGVPGLAAIQLLTVYGENQPPVLVDYFTVDDVGAGVRRYSWGFDAATVQSPDMAGVEIRYTAGSIPSPNWNAMIPISADDGFHTAPFQSITPEGGMWTFALRTRNTAGVLSTTMKTVQKVLSSNLAEVIVDVSQNLSETEKSLFELIPRVDENSETIIKQSLAQFQINDETRYSRAYIARVDKTYADATKALAQAIETVSAEVDDVRAAVQTVSEAQVEMDGKLSASWSVQAQLDANGRIYFAGMKVGVYSDGDLVQSEILMLANRFALMSTTEDNLVYFPFLVEGGTVYMNSAMIQDGSITNAKIGNVIQSDNFQWGPTLYKGWRIDKDGTALFGGDVTVRGTVFADRVTGTLQTSEVWEWAGDLVAYPITWTPDVAFPAPLEENSTHRPFITIQVECENEAGDPANAIVGIRRSTGGSTHEIISERNCYLRSGASDVFVFVVLDEPLDVPVYYSVYATDAGNRSDRFHIIRVTGQIVGVR